MLKARNVPQSNESTTDEVKKSIYIHIGIAVIRDEPKCHLDLTLLQYVTLFVICLEQSLSHEICERNYLEYPSAKKQVNWTWLSFTFLKASSVLTDDWDSQVLVTAGSC